MVSNRFLRFLSVVLSVAAPWVRCHSQVLQPAMDLSKPVHWGDGQQKGDTMKLMDVLKTPPPAPVEADTVRWRLYEKGDATYYSAKTHGRMMASGERYDRNGFFCAHKKLPFGTKIRVVNTKNGKEVIVSVKDRGPFARGRVIDLSNKAAEALDMVRAGVAPVELWVVE